MFIALLTSKIPFMKTIPLLIAIFFFLPVALFGQLTKGTWLLGGNGQLNAPTIIN